MPLTPKQLARRRHGIGASEAAAAVGISRYATPLDIYRRKTGLATEATEATLPMLMGTAIEAAIVDFYEAERGVKGARFPDTMFSARYPWMFAHLDWLGTDRVMDAKLSGAQGYGEPGTDQVPQEIACQLHHQMIVADVRYAQIALFAIVYYGSGRSGLEFRTYDVPYDETLGGVIIDAERELWERIQNLTPPPAADLADEVRLWPVSTTRSEQASAEVLAAVSEARELARLLETLGAEYERATLKIKAAMKDADTLLAGTEVLATWRSSKPVDGIDWKRLRTERPTLWLKLASRFGKAGTPKRPFLLKRNGDE